MKLTKEEHSNWCKFKIPGQSNLHRIKIDVVHFNRTNTLRHELAKALITLQLMLYGEATMNGTIRDALTTIEFYSTKGKEYHRSITEAQETAKTGLRRDLVDLTTSEIYEIETDNARARRHPKNINVIQI